MSASPLNGNGVALVAELNTLDAPAPKPRRKRESPPEWLVSYHGVVIWRCSAATKEAALSLATEVTGRKLESLSVEEIKKS